MPPERARARSAALGLALALALSAWLVAAPAAAFEIRNPWPVAAAGAPQREARTLERFRRLDLRTDARVVVRQGDMAGVEVEVEAEPNVLPLIETSVQDGTLVVRDTRRFSGSQAVVRVTARHLAGVQASGAVAVSMDGWSARALSLDLGGSSALRLSRLKVERLTVHQGGSSALRVDGRAGELSAALGGSAALQAGDLEASAVSVTAGGSAQALVWSAGALDLTLGGSSAVRYYGRSVPNLVTGGSATVSRIGDAPPAAGR